MTYKPDGERVLATLRYLRQMDSHGATWFELADDKGWHHGQASGVLSTLHKEGRIARLKEKRGKSSVYVDKFCVDGRDTVPYGRSKTTNAEIDANINEALGIARAKILMMANHADTRAPVVHNKTCWKVHVACALRAAAAQVGGVAVQKKDAA